MRRYLSALAVALVALSGAARVGLATGVGQSTLPIVVGYDLDSTGIFVFPIALGPLAVPSTVIRPQAAEGWYLPVNSPASATTDRKIKTTLLSATGASCVTNGSAFAPVSTNDLIVTNDFFGRPVYAGIFQKTDNNTVTFDRSLDLTQSGCATYRYRKVEAGTAATDGWFSVAGYSHVTVQVDIPQMVVTGGIDVKMECKAAHSVGVSTVLASSNISAASAFAVSILEPWDVCRVGFRIVTSDSDATPSTDNEKISVFAIRRE